MAHSGVRSVPDREAWREAWDALVKMMRDDTMPDIEIGTILQVWVNELLPEEEG